MLENGIIVNLGKKVGRPEGEQGGFQGYWGCDLGTNYTCNVSENSTYIFMNCTLCSMYIFFLKITRVILLLETVTSSLIPELQ